MLLRPNRSLRASVRASPLDSEVVSYLTCRQTHQWPIARWPLTHYHDKFNIGVTIEQNSGGTQVVNKLRAKYQYIGPWENMRMFKGFQSKYLAASQETLAKVASQRESFVMELGDPFYSSRKETDYGTGMIGFHLKAYELEVLWAQLGDSFKDAIKESGSSLSQQKTFEFAKELKKRHGKGYRLVDWSGAQGNPESAAWRPSVLVANIPMNKKEEVLKQLESKYGGRFWTVGVLGLNLCFEARSEVFKDPDFVKKYQQFPFSGSQ